MARHRAVCVLAVLAVLSLGAFVPRPSSASPCADTLQWIQQASLTGGARWDHVAIWDPVNERVIIHGGRNAGGPLADLWSFSPATNSWTPLTPTGGPGWRYDHTAIYDPVRERMLVYGGYGDDGYVWALATNGTPSWTRVVANEGPGWFHRMAIYDAPNDRMVIFGGTYLGSTWALELATNTWTELNHSCLDVFVPYGCAAVYDAMNQRMVVYGGIVSCLCICPEPSVYASGEVYALPLDVPTPMWQYLGWLPPLADPGAVYDPACRRLLAFGGLHPNDCVCDSLLMESPQNWLMATPLEGELDGAFLPATGGPPPARGHHVVVLDPDEHRLFTFGGGGVDAGCAVTYLDDMWMLARPGQTPPTADTPTSAPPPPINVSLSQNHPNPFDGATEIGFSLPQASDVRLEVFDLQGRSVAVLAHGPYPAGAHTVRWSSLETVGGRVRAGVYVYRLSAARAELQRRMIVLP